MQALDVAGTYGVLSLFGILPAASAWSQRYGRPDSFSTYRAVPGERVMVILVGCAASGVILNQAVTSLWGKY
jgi:tyrosine-specific transport protein